MASAAATDESNTEAKGKKSGFPLIPILIAVIVSTGASAGISFFLMRQAISGAEHSAEGGDAHGEEAKAEAKAPPNYVSLDPAFVVNLEADQMRFLQVQVQLMTRDPKAAETLKLYEPRIRNALMLIFSQQQPSDIATREGKEKLQASVLSEVQKILTDETGKPLVEAVYFTSFVMQ
ncbi:flagellar basal body-associated FliL family protein [Solimonas marina]|uniref:Flagellar protein FliL n=1 Tax=Solimonas marina TaxID=2714601 RepID=A0A970B8S9_9GAMM|nr:flagellar basal body-associated FliL family protein [Solimonas marina]NKF21696.1 flagellar basal body protein FliL [Solimonas marina]